METQSSSAGSESGALWYVLQVRSAAEKSVVENIKRIAKKRNVEHLFVDFNVPVVEIAKHGTVKPKQKVLCSGYVFVKMVVNESSLAVINELSVGGVGGRLIISFLPKAQTPKPLSEREYKEMLDTMMKSSQDRADDVIFEIGMDVKITSGAFKDFKGTVVNFDKEKSTLEVSVSVFNRETTVEVNFKDVEIIKS